MPSTPKKEAIAEAVAAALRTIRAGVTYRMTAVTVQRRRLIASEIGSTAQPAVSVWLGDSRKSDKACIGGYREQVDVLVEAWVKADPRVVETALNAIEADVTTALLTDPTLGGAVLGLERAAVKSDHQEFADRGQGWRPIRFVAEYNWTAAAP